MIVIKDLDFEMEQVKGTPFFNLKMPVIVNAGKANERVDMKLLGYGMPFDTCLKQVVSYKLDNADKSYSMEEYMLEYDRMVSEIYSLVTFKEKLVTSLKEEEENEDDLDELQEDI
jgi:hypothetical protein